MMTPEIFTLLVVAVGVGRLVELRISRRRSAALRSKGARPASDDAFPLVVGVHVAVLIGAIAEVWLLRRPFLAGLAFPAIGVFLMANILRWWCIHAMGAHWNVRVMRSTALGVVTSGPYRFVRHPNYVAVFVELVALPLIHTAVCTALIGTVAHGLVLRRRVATEDAVLLSDPLYRELMRDRPGFLPWRAAPTARNTPA